MKTRKKDLKKKGLLIEVKEEYLKPLRPAKDSTQGGVNYE